MKFLHKLLKKSVGHTLNEVTTFNHYPNGILSVVLSHPDSDGNLFPQSRILNGISTATVFKEHFLENILVDVINSIKRNPDNYKDKTYNLVVHILRLGENSANELLLELKSLIREHSINLYIYIYAPTNHLVINSIVVPHSDIAFELSPIGYTVLHKNKISLVGEK